MLKNFIKHAKKRQKQQNQVTLPQFWNLYYYYKYHDYERKLFRLNNFKLLLYLQDDEGQRLGEAKVSCILHHLLHHQGIQ